MKTCEKCGKKYGWFVQQDCLPVLEHCVCCNWDGPCVCPAGLEPKPCTEAERDAQNAQIAKDAKLYEDGLSHGRRMGLERVREIIADDSMIHSMPSAQHFAEVILTKVDELIRDGR